MRAVRELLDQRSRLLEASLITDAEHRPQDHVERDRPQPLVQRERLADGPGRDLLLGDRADRVLPAPDVLSVKRASSSLRWRMCGSSSSVSRELLPTVGSSTGLLDSPEWNVRGVTREHLANQVRIGDADDQPHAGKPRGAHRPIAAGEPPDVADRVKRVADTVDDRGHARPGKLCNRHSARRYHP